jgi:hypothetical protein
LPKVQLARDQARVMRGLWITLGVAVVAGACGENTEPPASGKDASADDAALLPDAAPLPDAEEPDAGGPPELVCDTPVIFADVVAGTSTSARTSCRVIGAPAETITALALEFVDTSTAVFAARFAAGTSTTSSTSIAIELFLTATVLDAGDHHATLELHYLTRGVETFTVIEARARVVPRLAWDPPIATSTCAADHETPLLDEVLALTNLDRSTFGFTDADLMSSRYWPTGDLEDEWKLSWLYDARAKPHRAGCVQVEVAAKLDRLLALEHPLASIIHHAANLIDRPVPSDLDPIEPRDLPGDALEAICAGACGPSEGALPPDLAAALAPVLWAIKNGIDARYARDLAATFHDPEWWRAHGGYTLLATDSPERWDSTNINDREYLLGLDRAPLYGAAAQIAYAIEHTDWSPFIGRMNVRYELITPAGAIRVRDGGDDRYDPDGVPVLLLVELGGADLHFDDIASNTSTVNAVSIAIDLSGDDRYEYDPVATPYDRPGLLPADEGGRYAGDAEYGNIAYSRHFRQGAATNGIAMLFDLGGGADHYQSLVGSQGYAHQGVGILFDDGGNDVYLAESGAQGSGQFGIGLLIDAGRGDDEYRSFIFSQGFGFSGGAGFLLDDGGNDLYACDHGDPNQGGIPLYYSPQLPNRGNTSMCQGAGFGYRGEEPGKFLSGGVGVLRDIDGDDQYEASVYAQGTGYWQGVGIFSDGDGSDQLNAYWYVQGGGAHYSLAIMANAGSGIDLFNAARRPVNVHLGAGHDFTTGVYISENSASEYHLAAISAGSSSCNAVGFFVDNGGDDQYFASSDYSSGTGGIGAQCAAARPNAISIGVMIEAGGSDAYTYPMSSMHVLPSEGGTWGHTRASLAAEHGAGLDRSGESGVHAVAP